MPYGQGSRQVILKLNQESNTLGKQNTRAASLKGKQEFKVCNDPKKGTTSSIKNWWLLFGAFTAQMNVATTGIKWKVSSQSSPYGLSHKYTALLTAIVIN